MNVNPVLLSIPVYFLLIGIELLIQAFRKRKIYRLNDAVTNISCGITQQVTGAFFKILTIGAYQYVFENWAIFEIPNTWWSWVLLVLGVDFFYYWAHRMSHEINLFWGGHVVHHQSEDYNFSVALRQSSLQTLWTFYFYLPLAIIGFDTLNFLFVSALNTVYQFWIHTETIGKLPKPIEYIFNTPSHHRVHHGRNPKYIDKNHAGSLIIWDRLFGTFQEEEERPTYGITKPLNTWNPVWANIQYYTDMSQQLKHTQGIVNKLKVIWYKPGWRPEEQGGYQSAPEVNSGNYIKYDNHPSLKMNLYVLVQFIIILALSSIFLFTESNYLLVEKLFFSSVIIWAVGQFGVLLDNNPRWLKLEILRIVYAAVIIGYLMNQTWVWIVVAGYSLVSLGWYFWIISDQKQTNSTVSKA